MKRAAILLLLAAVACSSTDDTPPPSRSDFAPRFEGRGTAAMGLEMLPPSGWWRDPHVAPALNLSNEQLAALDAAAKQHDDEIARFERDLPIPARDLRNLLATDKPTQADIVAAAVRLRTLRDSLFDQQVQLLSAERTVLTKEQWDKLQDELQTRRDERRQNTPYRGRGGMGRGRGRFPG